MKVMNPVTRQIVARGGAGGQLVLLHYRGRRTGRDFDTPVGYHRIGGQVYVLTNSPWRHNFKGGVPVEVTIRGRRRPAFAVLDQDPERVTDLYEEVIDEVGWKPAQRRLGLRINVGRQPTREELLTAVASSGLSAIRLEGEEL